VRMGLTGGPSTVDKIVAQAQQAESDGFSALWYASALAGDPLVAMAIAGRATSSIELGTAVLPTYPCHPLLHRFRRRWRCSRRRTYACHRLGGPDGRGRVDQRTGDQHRCRALTVLVATTRDMITQKPRTRAAAIPPGDPPATFIPAVLERQSDLGTVEDSASRSWCRRLNGVHHLACASTSRVGYRSNRRRSPAPSASAPSRVAARPTSAWEDRIVVRLNPDSVRRPQ
jgi:Luciferase-like monooxygenase